MIQVPLNSAVRAVLFTMQGFDAEADKDFIYMVYMICLYVFKQFTTENMQY